MNWYASFLYIFWNAGKNRKEKEEKGLEDVEVRTFMDENFLLSTSTAELLYHEVAEKLPIIDYHCHINPMEIAEDRKFESITQVWLGGDHYKWRLMRAGGVVEDRITQGASDWEKFYAFAAVMPKLIGNPIYHWSHLELQRVFGVYEPLNPDNAKKIYEQCNERIQGYSARTLLRKFQVEVLCTTDDPCDDLKWHQKIAEENMETKVFPTFRPDKALAIDKPGFMDYMQKLSHVAGHPIEQVTDIVEALENRMDYFAGQGCVCADHGLDACVYRNPDKKTAQEAFDAVKRGNSPTKDQTEVFQTLLLIECAKRYARKNWVMQIHFGCLRNVNRRQFASLGADTGYDAINSDSGVQKLASLLNAFQEADGLPKVIVYSLNPADNDAIATITACFQEAGAFSKIQQGSAWWFNDSRPGMRAQLTALAANGVLGNFVGMLTDSRSFLSYTRHEYFRRVLCELIGEWVESGQYPNDKEYLKKIVEHICYYNTRNYFNFEKNTV